MKQNSKRYSSSTCPQISFKELGPLKVFPKCPYSQDKDTHTHTQSEPGPLAYLQGRQTQVKTPRPIIVTVPLASL